MSIHNIEFVSTHQAITEAVPLPAENKPLRRTLSRSGHRAGVLLLQGLLLTLGFALTLLAFYFLLVIPLQALGDLFSLTSGLRW